MKTDKNDINSQTMAATETHRPDNWIEVYGAREHNLKNVDVSIPRDSLTVITGLSGSGKSSLAFDTIYAEGQRRYMETLSTYARQFVGSMERPDVDKIIGLSPVISIEQKTTNRNPRSTVGTVTEINDFLRLLFARAAEAYSPVTGELMVHHTDAQIVDLIMHDFDGRKIALLAPVVRGRKGHYRELFEGFIKKGYLYARVDGEIREVHSGMKLDRYKIHHIELLVDRLQVKEEVQSRLLKSLRETMRQGKGTMMVYDYETNNVRFYSRHLMCPTSGIAFNEPAPHTFSFNSPQGACPHCNGLGEEVVFDMERIIPDDKKSIRDTHELGGAGSYMIAWEGVADYIEKQQEDSSSNKGSKWKEQFVMRRTCSVCGGSRLKPEALQFKIDGKNIAELAALSIEDFAAWMEGLEERLSKRQQLIAHDLLKEIRERLRFLLDVGLGYLSLSRSSCSLSGGESQRIRLATQIGSKLVNVLYILDEPSIGLHQRDNIKLINSLKALRDAGNSVIVVEHDEEMIRNADWLVDVGPLAGVRGGEIVASGTLENVMRSGSITAEYLNGRRKIEVPAVRRKGNGKVLTIRGARGNNLKNITVDFPLGMMICVTGVSGSGKSTLINATLRAALNRYLYHSYDQPLAYDAIDGIENIDKMVVVDQSPIGRTPRSNPATYSNVFGDIRKLFEATPDAQVRGFKAGRFSFNVKGGRCEACRGAGVQTIEMNFLPDVYVKCKVCNGQRYNRETLEVKYKGKSINDVLNMTINQAVAFFEAIPSIHMKLKAIQDVGLGYLTLGQPCTTLSGGESQRIKLSAELAKRDTGNTLYILDEPTTGLHFEDIRVLLDVLNKLVEKGNSVIVIEHNLDVIKVADYLIDIGPEGGSAGGQLIATGTPEEVAEVKGSYTGKYLKPLLK